MKAAEIMTRDVATVRPDTSVHDAIALLAARNCTSLPVLDEDDRVIGIVSEVDLLRDRLPHDPRSHLKPGPPQSPDPAQRVRDVMSDTAICLPASADTADLAQVMVRDGIRAIPIIDGAHLVGIVSRRDVLRTLLHDDATVAAEISERLHEYSGPHHHWDVEVHNGVADVRGRFEKSDLRVVDLLVRSVPGVVRVHCHRRWIA